MADDDATPGTANFGFTRVGAGESLSKNGYAFGDLDRVKLDQLLKAAFTHTHSGAPRLGDPTDPPTLAPSATGGHLPAATTYFYRVSFVDEHGLETAASSEASVSTPNPVAPPTAPATTAEATAGSMPAGTYSYLVTYMDNYGGETTPSPLSSVQIVGGTTNRVRLDLPELPVGIMSYSIYRSRPGQSQFFYLGSTQNSSWYDTGLAEDQTITAPTINSTNSNNSVVVTIPNAFIPQGCFGWKIYRATIAGDYDGNSLVHEVTEGISDSSTTPVTTWTDTGDALLPGVPQETSSTVPGGSLLALNQVQGTLPLSAMPRGSQTLTAAASGPVTDGQLLTVTDSPAPVKPVRLTAFFRTPPTSNAVRIRVKDHLGTTVELACSSSTVRSGDPAGYFRTQWPLIEAASYEAEQGDFSDATVMVDNDDAAVSGQAVTLTTAGQWVQANLGVLDAGSYHAFATVRVLNFGATSGTSDLHIQVVRADTNAVLAETVLAPAPSNPASSNDYLYVERTGPVFTAPGGVQLYLRVLKSSNSSTVSYDVDSMRFTADVPMLAAGQLTVTAAVDGTSTPASDANITVWF